MTLSVLHQERNMAAVSSQTGTYIQPSLLLALKHNHPTATSWSRKFPCLVSRKGRPGSWPILSPCIRHPNQI